MPLGSLLRRAVVFALLCAAGVPALVPAQEPAKPMEPAKEAPVKEQTIYVPYTKLRAMFEKEGRGVFLPYDKFQELWKQAQAAAQKIEDFKPPVGAIITQIESQATTQKDVVSVTAKISIDLLTEGWHEVPLRLADSAIRSAKIGDEPARVRIRQLAIESTEPALDTHTVAVCKRFLQRIQNDGSGSTEVLGAVFLIGAGLAVTARGSRFRSWVSMFIALSMFVGITAPRCASAGPGRGGESRCAARRRGRSRPRRRCRHPPAGSAPA